MTCDCKRCPEYTKRWFHLTHCCCAVCNEWHHTENLVKEELCLVCECPTTVASFLRHQGISYQTPCEDCKKRLPRFEKEAGGS